MRDATTNEQWVYYLATGTNIDGRFFNPSAGTWTTFAAGSGEGW